MHFAAPVIEPRARRPRGRGEPAVIAPDVSAADALRLAGQMKALADPTRLRIVDVLRKAAPQAMCQCDLTPLFQISQQALSKHLGTLVAAGIIGSERRGVWTYYHLLPNGLYEISSWLT